MELNEIKKLLYKQAPVANFVSIHKGIAHYNCEITDEDLDLIWFKIPVSDMGEARFTPVMQAKHLIRWIDTE